MSFSYAHILDKYLPHIQYVMEDRTYDGIRFLTKDEPPSKELLDSFIAEEERLANIKRNNLAKLDDYYKERQHQFRVEAERSAVPLEDRLAEEYDAIMAEIHTLKLDAVEVQKAFEAKAALEESWVEISKAQEKINQQARDYLESTDWYFVRESETKIAVPDEVVALRAKARESIQHGIEVYAKWQQLRAKERPSREELKAAIKAGGEELKRVKALCQEASLRYSRPKK
jgi:hypothetical protein